jgi:hypothetical protein
VLERRGENITSLPPRRAQNLLFELLAKLPTQPLGAGIIEVCSFSIELLQHVTQFRQALTPRLRAVRQIFDALSKATVKLLGSHASFLPSRWFGCELLTPVQREAFLGSSPAWHK